MKGPSEKVLQAAVINHWRWFGKPHTLVAAIPNAGALGQPGLTAGLPDLMVVCDQKKVGFIELKRDGRQTERNGGLSEDQIKFRDLCELRQIPWTVTYGRDEPIAALEDWGVVARRSR